MESRGEDPPNIEDVDYFGLQDACKRSRGEFAIFSNKRFAARGRIGTVPLYWNPEKIVFSFGPDPTMEEFPEGHLYNAEHGRLVCWDPVYYDKPYEKIHVDESVRIIRNLIKDAINLRINRCEAFLLTSGDGAVLIDSFIDFKKIESYSVFFSMDDEECIEYDEEQNRTMIFINKCYDSPMHTLARFLNNHTTHKNLLCGLGCKELFSGEDFKKDDMKRFANVFAKYGLELYTPFLDSNVIEYVLDMTTPKNRPIILEKLLGR